jgi:AcrR family transcriptional regulator
LAKRPSARAYAPDDKRARREAILDAARRLFAAGTGDLPSVAHIAEAAGLAKGTVYLYFPTKEAIFADLLLEGWGALLGEVEAAFSEGGDRDAQVTAVLARSVDHFDSHPELLRLDALGPGVVERNLAPEALAAFKRALTDQLVRAGATTERALGLPPGRGLQVLMRTYALTRGLWQSIGDANSGAPAGHEVTLFSGGFRAELAEALAEYWRGALADTGARRD